MNTEENTETAPAPERLRGKLKVLTVSEELHQLLKRKAREEGRFLGALVEAKLRELVQPLK